LVNHLFALQNVSEKEQKLRAVLKNCADGTLGNELIDKIVGEVSLNHQYSIIVHNEPQTGCEQQSAMVTVKQNQNGSDEYVIHIYAP
jgi:hypothetical protein